MNLARQEADLVHGEQVAGACPGARRKGHVGYVTYKSFKEMQVTFSTWREDRPRIFFREYTNVGTAKRSGLKLSEFKSPQKGNFLI
jgi:hypothetical protein